MAKPVDDYCDACEKSVANHECDHGILYDECYESLYPQSDSIISLHRNQSTSDSSPNSSEILGRVEVVKGRTSNKSTQNISFDSRVFLSTFH